MKFYCQGQMKLWNKVDAKDKETKEPFEFFEYGIQTDDGSATVNSLKDFSEFIDKEVKMTFDLKTFQGNQRLVLTDVEEI